MINRNEALVLIKKYINNRELIRISFSVEEILKDIAKRSNKDKELWAMTGLLHNIDYEYTSYEPEKRGYVSSQLLNGLLPDEALNAIKANNYMYTGHTPATALDKALIASAAVSEFIISVVSSTDSKKLNEINFDVVQLKYNDNSFIDMKIKNKINICVDFGIDIKSFLNLSINSLKRISNNLLL